jgi:hypothetical protein
MIGTALIRKVVDTGQIGRIVAMTGTNPSEVPRTALLSAASRRLQRAKNHPVTVERSCRSLVLAEILH